MRSGFGIEYLIADSALYTAENLKSLNDLWWISRVPETLTLAIDASAPELMHDLNQSAFRSLETNYGDVEQRWLVIFSPQAYQRARKTLDKQCSKQSSSELKSFSKLCKQSFACEKDARKALIAFEKKLKLSVISDIRIDAVARFHEKGRPSKDSQPDFFDYYIDGAIATNLEERTRRLQRKSCFILATNQQDCEALPHEELIAAYKDQQTVERGFRFLKDPMFMASTLFLKSPKRIMALMMVMTLSLLIYAALEYKIREKLKAHHQAFPNQKGQLIQNPTARWVCQFFTGIHVLVVNGSQMLILNMNDEQIALLKLLGEQYIALIFWNRIGVCGMSGLSRSAKFILLEVKKLKYLRFLTSAHSNFDLNGVTPACYDFADFLSVG